MAQRPQPADEREMRAIAALNDCVQDRFKKVEERVGFSRLVMPGVTPHRFEPENVRELTAVRGLEETRLQVAVYVASRALVSRNDPSSTSGRNRVYRRIKGPAQITPVKSHDALLLTLPEASELLDDSQRAMAAFAAAESYEFTKGDWKFTARAVRASGPECLNCHRAGSTTLFPIAGQADAKDALKVGDPLGVVIYAYRANRSH